ncbi:uncharacterized protein J4E88_003071 [Alternaria novae-zelandiae]|uniref:uncharacterized protein n=1 Tax=Alternaria novae-zelandiae TaxID=430562 RepID=UPI0020C547DD|nr:uncharacterized protein J4E88_003071 [Alternaria novae-zelandiae]KAI4687482.1 hypothetical protein J4E88_003071 [Alternaria novae-zelandiae]
MGSLIVSRFDTQCIFARDIDKLDTILQVWLDNWDIAKPKANVFTRTFLYDFYHSFDKFRETYRREFQKEPYANEYTQWRWDVAKSVTKEENEDAVARLDTYRDWLLSKVFRADRYDTLMVLPVSEVAPNYRDRKTEPPSKQNAFDALYISPTIAAPEIVVPIAEFPYASRVSGREEKLPIAISVVGNPGTDLALVGLDFPKARVFTYGYDSSVSHFFSGPANRDNILDRGRDLLERLAPQREKVRGRRIIFIAHSLGGLVVKSALRLSAEAEDEDEDLKDILASTAGVLFFGTPHRGSLWVSTGKIISRFAKAIGFSTSNINLDLLTPNDAMLQILRDDFRKKLDKQQMLYVTSYQESLGYKGFNGFDEKINEAHDRTLSWLLQADQQGPGLMNWLAVEEGIFWIQGVPGSGKSTVMKYLCESGDVARTLETFDWSHAAFFLTREIEQENRSWKAVVGAIVYKLLCFHPALHSIIEPLVASHGQQSSFSLEELERILLLCKSQKIVKFRMCLFIDALDESDNDEKNWEYMADFLEFLVTNESDQGFGTFKICATSRPESAFDVRLKDRPGLRVQDWTKGDIYYYVHSRLESHRRAQDMAGDSEFCDQLQEICRFIVDQAMGVFLWVRLVVDSVHVSLSRSEYLGNVRARLLNLDQTNTQMAELYLSTLDSIPVETRGETDAIFRTLLAADKPVSVMDIGVLLEVIPYQTFTEDGYAIEPRPILDMSRSGPRLEQRIRDATGGLVQVVMPEGYKEALETWEAIRRSIVAKPSTEPGEDDYAHEKARIASRDELLAGIVSGVHDETVSLTNPDACIDAFHWCVQNSMLMPDATVWTVQFLHQTVREFLTTSDPSLISKINDKFPPPQEGFMVAGAMYHISIALAYIQLSDALREESRWTLEPAEIMMRYAPELDSLEGTKSYDLIHVLDRCLSKSTEGKAYWPGPRLNHPPAWKTTFLAFAVSNNMCAFVSEALRRQPDLIKKPGRPLLHYAGWSPGKFPNPTMADILLCAGANPGWVFDESPQVSKTALESLFFGHVQENGALHFEYMWTLAHFFDDSGFDSRVPCPSGPDLIVHAMSEHPEKWTEWTTIFHYIAAMPVPLADKIEFFKKLRTLVDNSNVRTYDNCMNVRDSNKRTVFEALLQNANPEDVTPEMASRMLRSLKAKITMEMVRVNFESSKDKDETPIACHMRAVTPVFFREEFRKDRYYTSGAKSLISSLNPLHLAIAGTAAKAKKK